MCLFLCLWRCGWDYDRAVSFYVFDMAALLGFLDIAVLQK